MSKWEKVKLGDVCDVERGGSPRPIEKFITEDPNGINWIKIGDASPDSKYITETKQKIITSGMKKSRYVQPGDFLLSNSMSFGRPYILKTDGCIHDGWLLLRDKNNFYHKEFLYYVLSSKSIYEKFKSLAVGGVVNNLNSTIVKQVELPFPPKDTQKQIAKTLDTAAELLAMRKQQLAELDSLIKSVFYEMFGDPILNDKGWRVENLINITTKVGSGATPKGGKESYQSNGISLIRSMNVHNGIFKYEQLAYINDEQANQLNSVIVKKKDVLINITGASVARSCIVPDDVLPARVNQHVSIIRLNQDIANSEYISNMFTTESYQKQLLSIAGAGGATREAITKQQLLELSVPLPPLHLQNQFATIVAKIEEQKALVKKAIEETQTLFDSLMAEYFED